MKLQWNPVTQKQLFYAHRINQSAASKNDRSGVMDPSREARKDLSAISCQGKQGSLIDTLMKQKMSIMEQKDALLSSAKKEGRSMESIQSQLDAYEEQLKDIDRQISQAMAKEMEKQAEKGEKGGEPKTKQEMENERLSHVMKLSQALGEAETTASAQARVDGEARVLKSEIELDRMYGNETEASREMISKKEAELSDLEQRSMKLLSAAGEIAAEAMAENEDDANTAHALTTPKPKIEDCVVVLKEDYFFDDIEQYLGVFEQYAKGEMSTYDFHGYIAGAERVVSWALDRSLTYGVNFFRAAYDLVEEMKGNLKNGVENTVDNLKTKFRIEGKDFTYREVSEIQKTGNYLQEMLGGNSPCGYDDYMKMGMARVFAYKPELGLTKDQAELLTESAQRRIRQKLEENKRWMEIAASEEQNSRWKGYYIGGSVAVASNTDIISETLKVFSEMDPSDKKSVEKAVARYQELLRPWNERWAEYLAAQLPGYARGYAREKAEDSRKVFYSYWNRDPCK